MAAGVPPPPLNSPSGSYYWLEWYTNLTNFLNGTNIPWSNLNFTNSNITDIQTRHHNDLQNIQGGIATGTGQRWHMVGSQFIGFVAAAGTAVVLPVGWTVSSVGAVYTIVHNLGLTPTTYVVSAAASGAPATVNQIDLLSNSFKVTLSAAQNFSFVLDQGS